MSEILPKGEKLRRAVRWISERREETPDARLGVLVSDAAQRFDLTPREAEMLQAFYAGGGGDGNAAGPE